MVGHKSVLGGRKISANDACDSSVASKLRQAHPASPISISRLRTRQLMIHRSMFRSRLLRWPMIAEISPLSPNVSVNLP